MIVDQVDGDQEEREGEMERSREQQELGAGSRQSESMQRFTHTSTIAHSIKPDGEAKQIGTQSKFTNLYIL